MKKILIVEDNKHVIGLVKIHLADLLESVWGYRFAE